MNKLFMPLMMLVCLLLTACDKDDVALTHEEIHISANDGDRKVYTLIGFSRVINDDIRSAIKRVAKQIAETFHQ